MSTKSKRVSNNPAGRPRSADLTERLHAAVFTLVKRGPYRDISMEALAAEAGVSRPALYRRYAGVGQVTLSALLSAGSAVLPMVHTKLVREDICAYFQSLVNVIAEKSAIGRALRGVLAEALSESGTGSGLGADFAQFIEKRREPVRERLLAWNSALTAEQLDAALDAMFGPILYRVLIRRVPVGKDRVRMIVEQALKQIDSGF